MKEVKRFLFGRIVEKLEGEATTPYVKLTNIAQLRDKEELEKADKIMRELATTNYVARKHHHTWRLVEEDWVNYRDELGIDENFAQGIIQRKEVTL